MVLFILRKSFTKKRVLLGNLPFERYYLCTYNKFFSVEKAEKLVSVIRVKRCVVQKDTQKMENTY